MHVRSRLVDLRVDGKRSGIDGLIPNNNVAILIHKNKIRHRDLTEVFREWIQPEMIRQNRIPNADVASDTFVETALSEYPVGGGQMLFPVESLFFEAVEFGICSDLKLSAVFRPAHRTVCLVVSGLFLQSAGLEGRGDMAV